MAMMRDDALKDWTEIVRGRSTASSKLAVIPGCEGEGGRSCRTARVTGQSPSTKYVGSDCSTEKLAIRAASGSYGRRRNFVVPGAIATRILRWY